MKPTGIELGAAGKIVQVPVSGSGPVTKIMCRRCGRVGGALPRTAAIDGQPIEVTDLSLRDDSRPVPTRGIPTTFEGTNFRSRLEARWAAFFDLIGWQWVYEPLDASGYIPDFLIQGAKSFLVEVGPCVSLVDYHAKSQKPAEFLDLPTLVVGVSPSVSDRVDYAGLLVNEFKDGKGYPAFWYWCIDCNSHVIYGDDVQRPCAHAMSGFTVANTEPLWREAGNAVQWRAA